MTTENASVAQIQRDRKVLIDRGAGGKSARDAQPAEDPQRHLAIENEWTGCQTEDQHQHVRVSQQRAQAQHRQNQHVREGRPRHADAVPARRAVPPFVENRCDLSDQGPQSPQDENASRTQVNDRNERIGILRQTRMVEVQSDQRQPAADGDEPQPRHRTARSTRP
jgi:hypothetical protein